MILDDIKNFIVEHNLTSQEKIKFDYDSSKGEDIILLKLYNNHPCDNARRASIKITVKFNDLKLSRDTCFALHDFLFPEDNYQKASKINGKTMHVKLNNGPCYLEKDSSKRNVYALDITITYNR